MKHEGRRPSRVAPDGHHYQPALAGRQTGAQQINNMEIKKSDKADLEGKRTLFGEIGMALALLVVLGAFEWSSPRRPMEFKVAPIEYWGDEELPPITLNNDIPKPTPPPPAIAPSADIITIIDSHEPIIDTEIAPTDLITDNPINIAAPLVEDEPTDVDTDKTLEIFMVDKEPMFPGGPEALKKFIASEVHYPTICYEACVSGRVFVRFVIDTDGSVTNVHVARSVDKHLDEEAMRVVKAMPRWTPGSVKGHPVRVAFTVPIRFLLE